MTTLSLIILLFAITAVSVLLFDKAKRDARRSDREIMRRFHRYMDSLPPKRTPW